LGVECRMRREAGTAACTQRCGIRMGTRWSCTARSERGEPDDVAS
jgi:hypothetical protein